MIESMKALDLRDFFTPDAIICWHDSNELLKWRKEMKIGNPVN